MESTLNRVAIHGVPRSGTSWLGELFNSSPQTIYRFQPLFSYALKGYLDEYSSAQRIERYFENLVKIRDDFINQTDARSAGLLPTFAKSNPTHVIYKEVRYHNVLPNLMQNSDDLQLIALIRNPVSVLESWIKTPREFRADLGWKVQEEWRTAPKKNQSRREEFFGFNGWIRAVSIFHRLREKYPDRVRLVRYEDLVASTKREIAGLFEFCTLSMTEQTTDFVEASTSRFDENPYSVFRGSQSKSQSFPVLGDKVIKEICRELCGGEFECYLADRATFA